jgi:hypothetical protein
VNLREPPVAPDVWTTRKLSDDRRLVRLIDRLPARVRTLVHLLSRPSSRWLRIAASVTLIIGGVFAILPVLGVWMLPIGLALLAEDVAFLRSWRSRILDWIEHRRPHWLHSRSDSHDRL